MPLSPVEINQQPAVRVDSVTIGIILKWKDHRPFVHDDIIVFLIKRDAAKVLWMGRETVGKCLLNAGEARSAHAVPTAIGHKLVAVL